MNDEPRVIVVLLRRPRLNQADERRDDPFWEFGSFGCTGCHRANLLSPKRFTELNGAHLVFVQGGDYGFRIVHVTPPISMRSIGAVCEANWLPAEMPLTYATAPTAIDRTGFSDFPLLARMAEGARRATSIGKFASIFRSRRKSLPADVGAQVLSVYDKFRKTATVATSYDQAMPYPPPLIEADRLYRYRSVQAAHIGACRTSTPPCP